MEERTRENPVRLESLDRLRHNCRVKSYPDGSQVLMLSDRAIFREPGWEVSDKWDSSAEMAEARWAAFVEAATTPEAVERSVYDLDRQDARDARRAADNLARAQRRAVAAVRDLGLSNDWRWFVTLTLDAAKVDRYDVAAITRHLNHWLDNQVRRHGLAYVLVPERHRDGAIHFHGLFTGALEAVDSGTIDTGKGKPRRPRSAAQRAAWLAQGGHIVYNLPAWGWGFTTALELYGDRRRAVGYVCKYIGKQMQPQPDGGSRPGKVGGRWYYSGGALQRPTVELADVDTAALWRYDGYEFTLRELGCRCKILEVSAAGELPEADPEAAEPEPVSQGAGAELRALAREIKEAGERARAAALAERGSP